MSVWGPWQVGNQKAADYAEKARQWAHGLKLVDPTIKLVSCGHEVSPDPFLGSSGAYKAEVVRVTASGTRKSCRSWLDPSIFILSTSTLPSVRRRSPP